LTWTLDDAGTLTISGTGEMISTWDPIQPSYLVYNPPWYNNRDSIKSVVIGEGVTTIGRFAFYNCTALTSVTIPAAVTTIGEQAFYKCGSLLDITVAEENGNYCSVDGVLFDKAQTTLIQYPNPKTGAYTIPDSVTGISSYAFYNCAGLTSITLPRGVTSIGNYAFYNCAGLTGITLPQGVKTIGESAFERCSGLTGSLTIPEGVETIGESAFEDCSGLTGSLTIPEGVTTIGEMAFYNCKGLTSLTLPEGITTIGERAFSGCRALTGSLTIPQSVTSLGLGAFANCEKLESVDIQGAITRIETSLFGFCKSLKSVTIPDTVTSIGSYAFDQCAALPYVVIPDGVTIIEESAFYQCKALTGVTLPKSIKTIGESAFYWCNALTGSVTIPSGASVGKDAFAACDLTEVILEDGVTSIGEAAFYACEMTSITIPGSVKNISDTAFWRCSKLTNVTIEEGVTGIGASAFKDCNQLADITIAESVTSIGNEAFENCAGLTSITIPGNVEMIGDKAFAGCTNLKDVTIHSENITIGSGNDMLLNFPAAEDTNSDGVYELENASDLYWFAQQVNTGTDTDIKGVLAGDIDLKDGTARGLGWSPIGIPTYHFVGSLDGAGHSVTNLDLGNPELTGQGLFGYIGAGGTVSNLAVSGSVRGNRNVGGVCAYNEGTLTNCHNAATVSGEGPIGGVCGYNSETGTIETCYNTATVTGADYMAKVGGVCGENDGTVINCYNTGKVRLTYGYGSNVGGVCGENGGIVSNCYNTAAVDGAAFDLAGGSIYDHTYVGGVCGDLSWYGSISKCYNTGVVSGTGNKTYIGGALGYYEGRAANDCYYLDTTAATGIGQLADGRTATAEAKTAGQFTSGEMARLLQDGLSDQVWGQGLTGDATDASPVLTSDSAKKVYQVTFQVGNSEHTVKYANPAGVSGLPEAPAAADGYAFYRWSQTNAADGAEFTANTPVSGDMTVYAVRQKQFGEQDIEHKIEMDYGTQATLDLAACVGYAGGTAAAGMFDYEIAGGNDTLGAAISGDTLTVPNTANAGNYTLSITATEKTPQVSLFSLKNPGTEPVTFTVAVTVNKVPSSVATPPTAKENLVYDKTAQALVNAGAADGGELQYSLDGTAYSADIPTGTDAKAYTVWYKVVGDGNHNDTAPQSLSVTIGKGTPVYILPANLTATYGQTLADVTLPTVEGGVWTWKNNTQSVGAAGEHTFQATYVPTDTGNYNAVTDIGVTVTVGKATPTVTAWPTAAAITYGQKLSDSALTGGVGSVDGSFSWTDGTVQPAVADSGTTWYAVTFTPTDTNYNTVTGKITLTVNKATPTVTAPTANTLTYTGEPQALVTAGSATGGELQYSLDGTNYSIGIPEKTNAGSYTVYYKVIGDENHSDTDPATVAVTIDPKPLDGTVTVSGAAAMNETLTAKYSDSDATVSYQWYRGNDPIEDATGLSYTLTAADVGQTVKVTATGTGNYTGTVPSAPTDAVTEALPDITALPTAGAITYGQTLRDSALTGGAASVEGTFAWADGAVKPAVSDSGVTEYAVTFTPSVDGYTAVTRKITVTVTPAPLTIAAVTPTAKVYDATTGATVTDVTFSGLVNGDALSLDTDYTVTASYDSANAGTRTLTAAVTLKNGNYALTGGTFEVTDAAINPKVLNASDVTVTVNPSRYEYTGFAIIPAAENVTVTYTDDAGKTVTVPSGEYTFSCTNNTQHGTATLAVTDKDGGNYTVSGTAAFQITKPLLDNATVTLGEVNYTYDGTAKEPTVTVERNGAAVAAGEYNVSYSNTNGGEGDHTSAGTVTLTVTATADGNYDGSKSVTFTIDPKSIAGAEILLGANPTYDGGEKTMTVTSATVDGLGVTYAVTSGQTGTNAGDYTLQITGSGNFMGTAEKAWSILPAPLSAVVFDTIEAQDFTDQDITPKPAVTLGGKPLVEGADFTYTYSDNRYVGTATVNVSGKGNYTGAATAAATFAIAPVEAPAVITTTATVTKGGSTVDLSRNVTGAIGAVSYALRSGDGAVDAQGVYTSPAASGSAMVTVTVAASDLNGDGVNEYTEKTADITVTIADKTMAALTVTQTGCAFGDTLPEPTYTEPAGTIATTKTYTGATRSGAAYESTAAPTDAGTYTVKVVCETATHLYEGTSDSFTIAPKSINGGLVTLGAALTYNTQNQTQSVSAVTVDGVDILASCDVTGNTAINAGEYTLTVTAKETGNYTGSLQKAYTVSKKVITPTVDGVTALDYTGSQLTQSAVTVKDGADALATSDYEIVYGENITAGTDAGSLTVKAKEGGNYSFSDVTVTFTIHKVAYPGVTSITSETKYGTSRTVDLKPMLAEGHELGEVSVTADTDSVLDGTPVITGTTLTFAFVDAAEKAGKTATIQVPVTDATNYLPYHVTVTVTVTDKLAQKDFKFAENAKNVVYGETLDFPAVGAVTGSKVTYVSSDPTVASVDETGKVTALKAGNAVITATASATEDYAQASASCTLQVDKATVTVKAKDKSISVGGAVPDLTTPVKDTDYTVTGLVGEDVLTGAVELKYQLNGEDATPDNTKAGAYDIVISGVAEPAGGNYNPIVLTNGKLTVSTRPSSSGTGSENKTETEKHEDGSVTTTVTDKRTGTKTATTKYTDGSETVVTTKRDGNQTVVVTIPAETVEAARESNETIRVQMPGLTLTESADTAVPVTFDLSGEDSAQVELPVEGVTPGTVAVIVKADGTEEIVKTSIPTRNGAALTVRNGQTVKIIDNSRTFEDVAEDAWYAENVAFVTARELFNGTSDTQFSPDISMSRGMLVTVLYRLENEPETAVPIFSDVPSGRYYTDAVGWAVENHIVDGYGDGNFGPDAPITREQLAVLLWRYAGSPASAETLDRFADAGVAGTWALDALRWAVEQGIIAGKGGGILDPTAPATRAEAAAMLQRFFALNPSV